MSADGAIVSDIQERLDAKAKERTTRARKRREKNKKMFVIFGARAFTCSVDSEECDDLIPGHALELAKAVHVLQRMMACTEWSSDGSSEFLERDREHANVGLEFLSGVVAEMLEASKEALPD